MMAQQIKIGMIGLDTSHCEAFTKILNNKEHPHYIPGAKVHMAYPGGSPDFEISISRVGKITKALQEEHQVTIMGSPEEIAENSDAILLTAVDGRVHLEMLKKIVSYGKPVFIDKPFAVTSEHAKEMAELSKKHNVPLMSASSIRFSDYVSDILKAEENGPVIGADCYGPMNIQETQPGLFWYGIHSVDTLYRIMGKGCVEVTATTNENYEFVVGVWQDGRIGTVRGNRKGNNNFGAAIHTETNTLSTVINKQPRPIYASLLEAIMAFFQTGQPVISLEETVEVIRFIEAANKSRETGKTVRL
jgi:predicted dehydrogenase